LSPPPHNLLLLTRRVKQRSGRGDFSGILRELAVQTAIHTRRGIERVLRFGFETALKRRKRLTMITKSNALQYGFVLWDQILEELRPQYPSITAAE
jgi:tartrate dehydrogenase/decarboxylase/D-malate dehydrogenase